MYVGPDDPIFAGRFPGRGGMGGELVSFTHPCSPVGATFHSYFSKAMT